jgi:hypothetical protein
MILKSWLGGLDSNQDSQIQSLESYQLDDLPAVEASDHFSMRAAGRRKHALMLVGLEALRGEGHKAQTSYCELFRQIVPQRGACMAWRSAEDSPGLTGTSCPFRIVNSWPPQVIRLEARLASQTAK